MYERIVKEMAIRGIRFIADLERKAGVSPGTIRNIRYGHTPTSSNLIKIADALGVTVNYLLTGETDIDMESDPNAEKRRKATAILDGLSPAQLDNAVHYLLFLASTQEKGQADLK